MLKWNSHEITKAKTIQARRKFRKRWPFKQVRVSLVDEDGAEAAAVVSFACSDDSTSFGPTTLCATELQISHVLRMLKLIVNSLTNKFEN